MDLSKSISFNWSIESPVAYALGDETFKIKPEELAPTERLDLVSRHLLRCQATVRQGGKSLHDAMWEHSTWRTVGFTEELLQGINSKTRVVQLSEMYCCVPRTLLPPQAGPSKSGAKWRAHALFVSESGLLLWASVACEGAYDSLFRFEIPSTAFLEELFELQQGLMLVCLEKIGAMLVVAEMRAEERLKFVRAQRDAHQALMGRIRVAT